MFLLTVNRTEAFCVAHDLMRNCKVLFFEFFIIYYFISLHDKLLFSFLFDNPCWNTYLVEQEMHKEFII